MVVFVVGVCKTMSSDLQLLPGEQLNQGLRTVLRFVDSRGWTGNFHTVRHGYIGADTRTAASFSMTTT